MLKDGIGKFREQWHRHLKYNFLLRNVASYINNEMLRHQGVDWEAFDEYRFYREFHTVLAAHVLASGDGKLKRIGGSGDGGYVMAVPFSREKIAYSFGVGKDVSWDYEIAENGYKVYQYDHTIKKLPCRHANFIWEKCGITGDLETDQLKRLDTLLKINGHADQEGMLLKMDVEGYEWEVLKKLDPIILKKFDQIVIELHSTNSTDRELMLDALQNLANDFAAIHLHGNNGGLISFCGNLVTPGTIEVTLVNKSVYECERGGVFPTDMDRPINPCMPEIWLGRWNP